jgi:CRISP-associated protein Cas1
MLIGHVSLSGPVLDYLINSRVETVFVTPTGRFRARLVLDEHRHVALRKAQYLRLSDNGFSLQTAGVIVAGKLANLRRMLQLRAGQYGDDTLKVSAARLRPMERAAGDAGNMERLRGIEGAGTRTYYSVFYKLIRNPQFAFNGRTRRPPLDPINALLSFAYTLITNEVLSAIKTVGLDPYLGSLHEESYGRPSLACDLVEEYRAYLADRLVLGLINRQMIRPDDFVIRGRPPAEFTDDDEMELRRPVEMKPAVCRAFIAAYEEMMGSSVSYPPFGKKVSHRWLIVNQVRAFAEYLQDPSKPYTPFIWEG